jgi:hypothetical protein
MNLKKTETDAEKIAKDVENESIEGTSNTHINVYLQELEDVFKQAHQIINEAELRYKALRTKLGL